MTPLWKHQLEIIERAKDQSGWGLWLEMGTGKTRTTIELLKYKMQKHGCMLRTLILAPTVVVYNWKKELVKFSNINPDHILVLNGSATERRRQLDRTPNYFIVVANYETLLMDVVFPTLRDWEPEVIIADESQRIKSHKAQRTKRAIALSHLAKYKYCLSGTPVTNNEADLFSQYLFLDGGETFGKSFFNFRNAWFDDANKGMRYKNPAISWPNWQPKKHKEEEFRQKVMAKASSVKKEECLDLPPYTQTTLEVGMSKEQARAYKEMKTDYITYTRSKVFSAELAVVKAMRLAQIASGFLMNSEGEVHQFASTPRDTALIDLIEEASSKVVVWAVWKANQQHLKELFKKKGINFRELLGDSSGRDRDVAMQEFADDPTVKVMLASQQAGGVGVSLVSANTAIYYSRNFSYEADAQSAARIHRGGQLHKTVTRIDLVIPDTIEVSCLEALARKEELKDSIINGSLKV